jgi:hypothetical protein
MIDSLDPDALRAAWAAADTAAFETLIEELVAATSPEEVYAAHARFVRATAADFSRQMQELSALLQRLAGLT